MEALKVIEYKGYKINIYQDELSGDQNPNEWSDDNVFLVNYHNDFYVENDKIITKNDVKNWYAGEKIEQAKDYHIFMLSCLIHSGVWLSLNYSFVSDGQGWDTSHIGIVLVSKKEARTKKKALKLAEGLLETWNDYLSGNVYGYDVEGIASCWGFYGDFEKSGLIEQAKDDIDIEAEKRTKKHLRKLRAYIRNNVCLDKREPLETTMFA